MCAVPRPQGPEPNGGSGAPAPGGAAACDPAAAVGRPRTLLGTLEYGIYRVLRIPVFLFLVVFRRYAGR